MSEKSKTKSSSSSKPASSSSSSTATSKSDARLLEALKHYDTFYGNLPPGMVKEDEEKPQDCIPNLPQNQDAREFLAKAPSKGLWMPLGKEVKVMQCWRCKAYGHRTGDKECPLFLSGNKNIEEFRFIQEDPMYNFVKSRGKEKEEKVKQLQALLEESTSDSDSSGKSSSSSSSSSRDDKHKRKKKKKRKKSHKHESKKHSKKRRK